MSDQVAKTKMEAKEEPGGLGSRGRGQASPTPVGPIGITVFTACLILFSILLLYGLVKFWPAIDPNLDPPAIPRSVTFLVWTFDISEEARLILMVTMAGALGGLVRSLRSFYWYVGHRQLKLSWIVMYILSPLVGATLGLVFYFVIRGGFFSPQATVEQTSPFGFAAVAGLVGMFAEQAMLKLKKVAELLLEKPEQGADAVPQEKEKGKEG